jgi:hypothetical protein
VEENKETPDLLTLPGSDLFVKYQIFLIFWNVIQKKLYLLYIGKEGVLKRN